MLCELASRRGRSLFQHPEQKVGVARALVRFVDHDDAVLAQEGVEHGLSKEHAIGQVCGASNEQGSDGAKGKWPRTFDPRPCRRREVFEPDRVADLVAENAPDLFGDPCGHARRRHASRLGACDDPALGRPARFEEELGQLGRLAASRLTDDDDDGVRLDGVEERSTLLGNRKVGPVGRDGQVGRVGSGGQDGLGLGGAVDGAACIGYGLAHVDACTKMKRARPGATVPGFQNAMPLLDRLDPLSARLGSGKKSTSSMSIFRPFGREDASCKASEGADMAKLPRLLTVCLVCATLLIAPTLWALHRSHSLARTSNDRASSSADAWSSKDQVVFGDDDRPLAMAHLMGDVVMPHLPNATAKCAARIRRAKPADSFSAQGRAGEGGLEGASFASFPNAAWS